MTLQVEEQTDAAAVLDRAETEADMAAGAVRNALAMAKVAAANLEVFHQRKLYWSKEVWFASEEVHCPLQSLHPAYRQS